MPYQIADTRVERFSPLPSFLPVTYVYELKPARDPKKNMPEPGILRFPSGVDRDLENHIPRLFPARPAEIGSLDQMFVV
jgi:hypothetical protein